MRIPVVLLAVAAGALTSCTTYAPAPVVAPAAVVAPAVVIPTTAATLTTATKAPFGTYLVDGAGRAVYVLDGTRNMSGVNRCSGACLGVWPPVMTAGPTVAAAGVNPAMVGLTAGYGGSHSTYAGWPLYYYSHDHAPGDTTGQDVHDAWGHWYLLSPSGEPIRPVGGY